MLKIIDLSVKVEDKIAISNLNMELGKSQLHVIMGPNGCGKSSLAYTILGHPLYKIFNGKIFFEDINILELPTEKRAKLGIFLAFQNPVEIPGVQIFNFLRSSYQNIFGNISISEFQTILYKFMDHLNDGFSGGEKKKLEILQMLILKPKLVILDEIDSGLDIDAVRVVASVINQFIKDNEGSSFILITHNTRILKHLFPYKVHIMQSGNIIKSGQADLATTIENFGYEKYCSTI